MQPVPQAEAPAPTLALRVNPTERRCWGFDAIVYIWALIHRKTLRGQIWTLCEEIGGLVCADQ